MSKRSIVTMSTWSPGCGASISRPCAQRRSPPASNSAKTRERILRLRERLAEGVDVEKRIRTVDEERARYLQQYWGKYWLNPHLYDLMISSQDGEAETARIIQAAMTGVLDEALTSK